MTQSPKEYAIELVNKFYKYQPLLSKNEAKIFAMITVNEIIEEVRDYCDTNHHQNRINYYQAVLKEIQNIK